MKTKNFKSIFRLTMMLAMVAMFFGCSKDDGDYREEFTGSYSGNESYMDSGITVTSPYTAVVTKSSEASGKVVINAEFMVAGRTEAVAVDVAKDGSFNTTFPSIVDGVSQTVIVSTGKFANGTLKYSYFVQGYYTYNVNVTKL